MPFVWRNPRLEGLNHSNSAAPNGTDIRQHRIGGMFGLVVDHHLHRILPRKKKMMSQGVSNSLLGMGMGNLQPLVGNPYFMGPYKPLRTWVDEFIPYDMEIMGVDRPDRTYVFWGFWCSGPVGPTLWGEHLNMSGQYRNIQHITGWWFQPI